MLWEATTLSESCTTSRGTCRGQTLTCHYNKGHIVPTPVRTGTTTTSTRVTYGYNSPRRLSRDPVNEPGINVVTGHRQTFNVAEENNLY